MHEVTATNMTSNGEPATAPLALLPLPPTSTPSSRSSTPSNRNNNQGRRGASTATIGGAAVSTPPPAPVAPRSLLGTPHCTTPDPPDSTKFTWLSSLSNSSNDKDQGGAAASATSVVVSPATTIASTPSPSASSTATVAVSARPTWGTQLVSSRLRHLTHRHRPSRTGTCSDNNNSPNVSDSPNPSVAKNRVTTAPLFTTAQTAAPSRRGPSPLRRRSASPANLLTTPRKSASVSSSSNRNSNQRLCPSLYIPLSHNQAIGNNNNHLSDGEESFDSTSLSCASYWIPSTPLQQLGKLPSPPSSTHHLHAAATDRSLCQRSTPSDSVSIVSVSGSFASTFDPTSSVVPVAPGLVATARTTKSSFLEAPIQAGATTASPSDSHLRGESVAGPPRRLLLHWPGKNTLSHTQKATPPHSVPVQNVPVASAFADDESTLEGDDDNDLEYITDCRLAILPTKAQQQRPIPDSSRSSAPIAYWAPVVETPSRAVHVAAAWATTSDSVPPAAISPSSPYIAPTRSLLGQRLLCTTNRVHRVRERSGTGNNDDDSYENNSSSYADENSVDDITSLDPVDVHPICTALPLPLQVQPIVGVKPLEQHQHSLLHPATTRSTAAAPISSPLGFVADSGINNEAVSDGDDAAIDQHNSVHDQTLDHSFDNYNVSYRYTTTDEDEDKSAEHRPLNGRIRIRHSINKSASTSTDNNNNDSGNDSSAELDDTTDFDDPRHASTASTTSLHILRLSTSATTLLLLQPTPQDTDQSLSSSSSLSSTSSSSSNSSISNCLTAKSDSSFESEIEFRSSSSTQPSCLNEVSQDAIVGIAVEAASDNNVNDDGTAYSIDVSVQPVDPPPTAIPSASNEHSSFIVIGDISQSTHSSSCSASSSPLPWIGRSNRCDDDEVDRPREQPLHLTKGRDLHKPVVATTTTSTQDLPAAAVGPHTATTSDQLHLQVQETLDSISRIDTPEDESLAEQGEAESHVSNNNSEAVTVCVANRTQQASSLSCLQQLHKESDLESSVSGLSIGLIVSTDSRSAETTSTAAVEVVPTLGHPDCALQDLSLSQSTLAPVAFSNQKLDCENEISNLSSRPCASFILLASSLVHSEGSQPAAVNAAHDESPLSSTETNSRSSNSGVVRESSLATEPSQDLHSGNQGSLLQPPSVFVAAGVDKTSTESLGNMKALKGKLQNGSQAKFTALPTSNRKDHEGSLLPTSCDLGSDDGSDSSGDSGMDDDRHCLPQFALRYQVVPHHLLPESSAMDEESQEQVTEPDGRQSPMDASLSTASKEQNSLQFWQASGTWLTKTEGLNVNMPLDESGSVRLRSKCWSNRMRCFCTFVGVIAVLFLLFYFVILQRQNQEDNLPGKPSQNQKDLNIAAQSTPAPALPTKDELPTRNPVAPSHPPTSAPLLIPTVAPIQTTMPTPVAALNTTASSPTIAPEHTASPTGWISDMPSPWESFGPTLLRTAVPSADGSNRSSAGQNLSSEHPVELPSSVATPLLRPTLVPTTLAPTGPPMVISLNDPTDSKDSFHLMLNFLQTVSLEPNALRDPTTPNHAAIQWLSQVDQYYHSHPQAGGNSNQLVQRYAMALLSIAFHGGHPHDALFANPYRSECQWFGVSCNSTNPFPADDPRAVSFFPVVTDIVWSHSHLTGPIPQDIGLLRSLQRLDLGENALTGSMPHGLYTLSKLQYLYLHQNRLSGTISERISMLPDLVHLYLGDNQLTGPFPWGLGSKMRSRSTVRPLTTLILFNNSMSGTIPHGLNLRNLEYLDLGYNEFSGTIPSDWSEGYNEFSRLRHLYLNNNKFGGTLADSFAQIGKGRLSQMILHDNHFSGVVPGGYTVRNFLEAVEIQHNNFIAMDHDYCALVVFVRGEMTTLRTDCRYCNCTHFCEPNRCYVD